MKKSLFDSLEDTNSDECLSRSFFSYVSSVDQLL
jgi:hypothetical protein